MPSRVSHAQIYSGAQVNVAAARSRQTETSDKACTQKEIVRPSQDPAGWMIANSIRDRVAVQDAINKNASLAQHVLSTTETLFSELHEYCERAHELSVQTSGTLPSKQSRQLILSEVENLYEVVLQVLNSRYGDRNLLSGFHSHVTPFDEQANFHGDQGVIEIEIEEGVRLPMNVSATELIEGKGIQEGVNIPAAFKTLMKGLAENDHLLVEQSTGLLFKAIDQISIARGIIGARMNNIARTLDLSAARRIEDMDTISSVEEADMVKIFSDLARDQSVMNTALLSTHKILYETPTDALFK